jgi:hypothetical protein
MQAMQVTAISETSHSISLEEGCLHFFHEASLYHPSDGAVHTRLKWGTLLVFNVMRKVYAVFTMADVAG